LIDLADAFNSDDVVVVTFHDFHRTN
jgi:hypothetical protein